jgi:SCF-associated factor 1
MPSISDIPVDVLLDNLLPSVAVPDLLSLTCTNRFFAIIGADDTFWKRKIQDDFNFSGAGTARTTGWKVIYKGLRKPLIYTWGENNHGRLGRPNPSQTSNVPFPAQLRIPGVRIVNLIAGGMSFHALDSEGNVYVWGSLDGSSFALESDGFSESAKQTGTPLKLALPAPMRSISCGRLHSSGLDDNSDVWTFLSWGRPFRLISPLLDHTTPESTAIQVECGWAFSSALTKSGDVLVWFPFKQPLEDIIRTNDEAMDAQRIKAVATPDKVIPCATWDLTQNPARLPPLPPLPELMDCEEEIKLIKIASFDGHLIGLTNQGHVLKFGSLDSVLSIPQGRWEYLPNFSETAKIRQHPVFSSPGDQQERLTIELPETIQITHVSAHFGTFVAYSTGSSSIVLMGDTSTTDISPPDVIPELQNISVISVVLGDYHFGALTATGKLLTWGQYSKGALGLGDPTHIEPGQPGGFSTQDDLQMALNGRRIQPPKVDIPTPVRFDYGEKKRKDMFCFAAAAAGWHMGALVIDLETNPNDSDEDSTDESGPRMPGHYDTSAPRFSPPPREPREAHFFGPPAGVFRIGFAGRGFGRGGLGPNI